MVCIAAFINLLIIWMFTPVLRLFGFKKQADSISKMFKKSTACFTKRVTLQACDSNFKDEIKNSVLQKLIVRHKKWVKPVSIGIEVASFLIIVVTVWSLLTVVKSGLSLYVYGTCDVRKPNACSLSSGEACSIDSVGSGNFVVDWFDEWKEVFEALPARMSTWKAEDFVPKNASYYGENTGKNPEKVAVDVFDAGCLICRQSFENQLKSGFFENYKTYMIPYVIRSEGKDKFANSELVARYIESVRGEKSPKGTLTEWFLVERLFTGKNGKSIRWQDIFIGQGGKNVSGDEAREFIRDWLKEIGYSDEQISKIEQKTKSDEISKSLEENRKIVEEKIKTKRIPTMIFDGVRHDGLYRTN